MKLKTVFLLFLMLLVPSVVIVTGEMYQKHQHKKMMVPYVANTTQSSEENKEDRKDVYVIKTGDSISVRSKYSNDKDIEVNWARNGMNNLFNYKSLSFISNIEDYVSNEGVADRVHATSTDFFGPHKLLAVNNIDGDYLDETHFTGGSHAYDGGGMGSPTARTENVKLYVDGVEKDDFTGYADEVRVEWANYVQASNTKKVDGLGREAIKENYNLTFDGNTYTVNNTIDFLEDVRWEAYYGLQASYRDMWDKSIAFNGDTDNVLDGNEDNRSKIKKTEKIVLNKESNYLEFGIDGNFGIGDRTLLNNRDYGAFNIAKTNKAYFWLVDGANFAKDDTVEFKGYYRFYSE